MHTKIHRKNKNLSEGLHDYAEKLLGSNENYFGWAKKTETMGNTNAQKQIQSSHLLQPTKEASIQKSFQLDYPDYSKSVIQTIDSLGDLVCFGGFDKVLKIIQLKEDSKKKYEMMNSVYMEGLPILNAYFVDTQTVAMNFLKKGFVSFMDLQKMKNDSIYKLFSNPVPVELLRVAKDKTRVGLSAKNFFNLIDCRTRIISHKSLQSSFILDFQFTSENQIAVALNNLKVRIFDVRKGINTPLQEMNENCQKIAGNSEYLVLGQKNGFVKLFKEGKLIKTYSQLTTDITSVQINESFLSFASKWKANQIRVAKLSDLKVLPLWPNIKTKLDLIETVSLSEENRILLGNNKGAVSSYEVTH